MSLSIKSVSKSLKNVTNIVKNDKLTIFVAVLTVALSVGYFVNKNYHAIVIMYLIAGLMFLLYKNFAYSLGISIIITNLFLSLNIINIK